MEDQKKVLITGASGALGTPVVARLLKDGWNVYALLRSDKAVAEMKGRYREISTGTLSFLSGDVTKAGDVERAVHEMGSISALVHLAGGFTGAGTMATQDPEVFDQLFNLNTRSAFLLLRAILPVMKDAGGGAIVTIGAKPAVHPGAVNAVYAASKAALINLTLSAAEEGRPHQVRANVIVPAVIRTEANEKWAASEKDIEKWTPPDDIAGAISWLISAEGKPVTGTVIPMYNRIHT
jgi:NAD(P)-dependent dehydrogenase (short-subunit alcohol dehydrogenase family)